MTLVVVGSFPPPVGGVSVFVSRRYRLCKGRGAKCVDLRDKSWFVQLVRFSIRSDHHFELNSTNLVLLVVFWILGILPRTAIFDHNSSRHIWGKGLRELVFLGAIKRCAAICIVHEHLRVGYEKHGFIDKVIVESPFLPPVEEEFAGVVRSYPKELSDFLEPRSVFRVATSAWKFVPLKNGQDLYGIRQFVELLEGLLRDRCSVQGLLMIGDGSKTDLPAELVARLELLSASGALLLVFGQYEFWPIYRKLNLFVRLTETDGNSVSVLEALYYRCPVIASDVVPRPDGVETYKYGDSEDLRRRVLELLERF